MGATGTIVGASGTIVGATGTIVGATGGTVWAWIVGDAVIGGNVVTGATGAGVIGT